MHIDFTPEKMSAEAGNPAAGRPAIQTIADPADTDKTIASPRAAYALKKHNPHGADPDDSSATYWAERWRLVEYLPTIDTARRFLELIGGRL